MSAHTITEADDGTRITCRVGDTVVVRLADNATTGYRWELVPLDGPALVVDGESYAVADGRVGSGGTAVWVLRVLRAGTATVAAKRWRPWEGETSVIQRFTVQVEAAGPPRGARSSSSR